MPTGGYLGSWREGALTASLNSRFRGKDAWVSRFPSTLSEPRRYEVAALIYKLGIFFLRGTRPCGIESNSS